jgi:hypothetical protein
MMRFLKPNVFGVLTSVNTPVDGVVAPMLPFIGPENPVDANIPVDGLNVNLVLETFSDVIVPVVALVNVKYRAAFVVVSSEIVKPPDAADHAKADPFQVRTVLDVVGAVMNEVAPAPV